MKVPKGWTETIFALHRALVSGERSDDLGLRESALVTATLPLTADMGGFFGIRLTREVVGYVYDKLDNPLEITEERIFNSVLFHGARIYNELAPLSPQRGPNSVECPYCNGTGVVGEYPGLEDKLTFYCGGLGWIPNTDSKARVPD